ncbi:MAG: protein-export membrane protein SecF [Candidatus Kerfeldbacteria bacterium RIFOXYA2_FULL_38_24]|uniref:Protein-export membrane protein SecF n=1 Tax=Candidatus Kerfeldbacteria bacterium RIFOXYB2_FULL_38_14 TaxID=1798547 RepID=A0A1G2BD87_9BACT|nr:MAG: protein-export membrane protein SecF [Candidatus Kerfeldbacteria bacterium RIFOXYA2_FULL_38_24]OGY86177.1 MAG: protein-export membrane protein SecF [Candidatus Kerfeldbacteria bacterium RIFOXYB2_FULL_38_14]OGY89457.1 MAG: protein-export membrane protein SecF [Candidatus Kerfeldbacteria bacterium RIFOXYC2_FULL_38_9]
MYNIVKTTKYWGGVSVVLVLTSLIFWFIWGLNLGIDFTGGTSMQVSFADNNRPSVTAVGDYFNSIGIIDARLQTAGDNGLNISMQQISNDQRQQILNNYQNLGIIEENFASVGPTLGKELKTKSFYAIILVLLAIIGYISYAFRKISKGPVPSWVYGVSAIVALVHDILIVIGVFVVLGHFWNVQIDTLFVTALLTVLGFSVHDTIVVYDRIREGLKEYPKKSFREIMNESINNTMARSLNTSLTTLIVLLVLFLFGGASIKYFILALLIGIISGTYSSIFIASPLLLLGKKLLKR